MQVPQAVVPTDSELLGDFKGWALYLRPLTSKGAWKTLKLLDHNPGTRKANFYLGWNASTGAWAGLKDMAVFYKYGPPEVFAWLERTVEIRWPRKEELDKLL